MALFQRGCCCSIRACVEVIAWFDMIGALIAIGCTAPFIGRCPPMESIDEYSAAFSTVCQLTERMLIATLPFYTIIFIGSLLLEIGIHKANRHLVLCYIIGYPVSLIALYINSIYWIAAIAKDFGVSDNIPAGTVVPYGVCGAIGVLVSLYKILCAVSHYQNLKAGLSGFSPQPLVNVYHHHTTAPPPGYAMPAPGYAMPAPGYAIPAPGAPAPAPAPAGYAAPAPAPAGYAVAPPQYTAAPAEQNKVV